MHFPKEKKKEVLKHVHASVPIDHRTAPQDGNETMVFFLVCAVALAQSQLAVHAEITQDVAGRVHKNHARKSKQKADNVVRHRDARAGR